MKTQRLTKKYKSNSNRNSRKSNRKSNSRKSNSKSIKIKSKSKKRILKGGLHDDIKLKFFKDFFTSLDSYNFPNALCALHTFYTSGITRDDINDYIRSSLFKKTYDYTFFTSTTQRTIGTDANKGFHTNIEARERLIFFLSYIFKKIAEGDNVKCLDKSRIFFTYKSEDENILNILQRFFGYLDTACSLTISFMIDQTTFDIIKRSKYHKTRIILDKPHGVKNGQLALYDLYTSLELLAQNIPTMKNDIEELLALMTTGDAKGNVYSFNTTNMCTLINIIQHLYTYFDEPESEPESLTAKP